MSHSDTVIAQNLPAQAAVDFSSFGMIAGLVIAAAAIVYLGFAAWLFLSQSRLTYLPSHDIWRTPREAGLEYEEVWLRAADGVNLHGWWIPAPGAGERTLLFCHGNGGNIAHRVDFARMIVDWGCNVLLFDYRGFGRSEGAPSERGTYADADAAWRFLVETAGIPPERIVIYGRSLGAAIAAELALRTEPAGVILESGFTTLPEVGARLYPWFPIRLLARNVYPTIDRIARIRSPLLIAHSREDELIPIEQARRLFEAARAPKEFYEMTGTHAQGIWHSGERYHATIRSFLFRVIPEQQVTRPEPQ